jgi:hypothetical protein
MPAHLEQAAHPQHSLGSACGRARCRRPSATRADCRAKQQRSSTRTCRIQPARILRSIGSYGAYRPPRPVRRSTSPRRSCPPADGQATRSCCGTTATQQLARARRCGRQQPHTVGRLPRLAQAPALPRKRRRRGVRNALRRRHRSEPRAPLSRSAVIWLIEVAFGRPSRDSVGRRSIGWVRLVTPTRRASSAAPRPLFPV